MRGGEKTLWVVLLSRLPNTFQVEKKNYSTCLGSRHNYYDNKS